MITIDHKLKHIVFSHVILLLFFSIIYYKLFDNPTYHYLLNKGIPYDEYIKNKLINSIHLSANLQFTTGHVDFHLRSPLARIIGTIHLFTSIIITVKYFSLSFLY